MNGADRLISTLTKNGVQVCFANPGTSEMHFVAALDRSPDLKCVLGLFEGVVTGAADGYARMTGVPAATLLHLGPGLANGMSNLHNALRARSPIVNIIGDHATYHRQYDAPLTSDIEGAARPFSSWVRASPTADAIATDAAAAITAARTAPGGVASLILPADTSWSEPIADAPLPDAVLTRPQPVDDAKVRAVAEILRTGEPTGLIVSTDATRDTDTLDTAGRIAAATGARVLMLNNTAVTKRGAGRVPVERIPYPVPAAVEFLKDFKNLILVGTKPPVSFFAYPDKPSEEFAPGTRIQELATDRTDARAALEALAGELGASSYLPIRAELDVPEMPTGSIDGDKLADFLAVRIPDNGIVVDESITTGRSFYARTATARPHDYLVGTGGSIGYAMANSIGAATACPDREVITLESDGSGLYMPQALWTQARENLNITTLVFSNRKYQILRNEMQGVQADFGGPRAESLMDLSNPQIDWVQLAGAMGVPGHRATTMEELNAAFDGAGQVTGPTLIEVSL
ncbi:acetolactate synthase large subunit [Spelaeicoccus albus]|uniref:Acetolactate synthase-1/2/3 large subunit n=1 Tax=Spelaeicoccus albus TaxID=1280376 RepID=A0A7Z0IJ96_9MICO|nr:acetolactate synthase large subunit [Spelaeicoccus albus]NYI69202.1 acetolactate synthase-1/2/3 large subunit [Spelaeicoccus albus]